MLTGITDHGLAALKDMKKLSSLTLGRNITDVGLEHLKEVKSLQRLSLIHSGVTDEGVEAFKKAIPGARVYHSKPDPRILRPPGAPRIPPRPQPPKPLALMYLGLVAS